MCVRVRGFVCIGGYCVSAFIRGRERKRMGERERER